MKNILFVLGGLSIGGVETYIVRLASELKSKGNNISVILLSNKVDKNLLVELESHSNVYIHEIFPFLGASSWLNAFIPFKFTSNNFDIVHVVDLLTLSFIYFHRDSLNFEFLSIGIYHSKEITWWNGRKCYFRDKMIELYNDNIEATLFPSESIIELARHTRNLENKNLAIVPLGISCIQNEKILCNKASCKIVSVGRLVDFKVYNRHVITQLKFLRTLRAFEYYIYGDGPEKENLIKLAVNEGVIDFVHFMGEIEYKDFLSALDDSFCFIGSGTAIIEASAAGIPSIVGIESIAEPLTCGLFSDVQGFSYNEEFATSVRLTFYSVVKNILAMDELEYEKLSNSHKLKAGSFDIKKTSELFLTLSNQNPIFNVRFNRFHGFVSFIYSIFRFGPNSLKRRFISH